MEMEFILYGLENALLYTVKEISSNSIVLNRVKYRMYFVVGI
jgi:hypothetical protein